MNQSAAIVIFGLSPFIIMAIIGILFGFYYFIGSKLSANDMPYLLACIGGITVLTLAVLIFIKNVCSTIHPTERFDNAPILLSAFIPQVVATEKEVCTLITQTDNFIKGDQGSAGHKDSSLVTAAQEAARAAVIDPTTKEVVPLTDCGAPWDASEVENRISRLELTLKMFTGPEIQKTYNSTVPCESFVSGSGSDSDSGSDSGSEPPPPDPIVDPALIQRLAAINAVIDSQRTQWLTPIQQKMADLKQGKVSSCDKQKGSTAGQGAVSSATPPPPT